MVCVPADSHCPGQQTGLQSPATYFLIISYFFFFCEQRRGERPVFFFLSTFRNYPRESCRRPYFFIHINLFEMRARARVVIRKGEKYHQKKKKKNGRDYLPRNRTYTHTHTHREKKKIDRILLINTIIIFFVK